MNYVRKIKIRSESKASCTKSGLIPIKALNIVVKLLRFFTSTSAFQWHENVTVPVTTLDKLIRKYGSPAVCKIDV